MALPVGSVADSKHKYKSLEQNVRIQLITFSRFPAIRHFCGQAEFPA